MTELDCRILARACDLNWAIVGGISNLFTTPDDWEVVRVKVVVPNMIEYSRYMALTFIRGDAYSVMLWMGKQTPENFCESVIEFIKSRPDLFPWVREMLEEEK